MILDAYVKHSEILTKEMSVDPEILNQLDKFIQPYLEELEKQMGRPTNLPLPNKHSTIENNRNRNGNLGYFRDQGLIKYGQSNVPFIREQRMDPIVIHLIGKPGIGKSYSVR